MEKKEKLKEKIIKNLSEIITKIIVGIINILFLWITHNIVFNYLGIVSFKFIDFFITVLGIHIILEYFKSFLKDIFKK